MTGAGPHVFPAIAASLIVVFALIRGWRLVRQMIG